MQIEFNNMLNVMKFHITIAHIPTKNSISFDHWIGDPTRLSAPLNGGQCPVGHLALVLQR